jgi:hypothetical protein
MIKLTDKSDPIKSIENYGFIKIRNREEYLGIIPTLTEFGYSLVGDNFSSNSTPFDKNYGGRKKERKNSIYLMVYWGEDKDGKYDKWLWIADYLDKSRVSEKFPIGQPNSY